ncbi:META domain-containing protein [Streptomyces sp. NPDC048111]|uniref:META domain-containing protein n=1 Tax=Streptomyces sp. NPDC048111 TaxID=3365500 RepID=UPI00371992C3
MKRLGTFTSAAAALLVLAACGPGIHHGPVSPPDAPQVPLTGREWTGTTLYDGDLRSPLPDAPPGRVRLTFTADGQVEGTTGCNTVHGPATVSLPGRSITFGPLASTRVLCDEPRMRIERRVLAALHGKVGYDIARRTLTLSRANRPLLDATTP